MIKIRTLFKIENRKLLNELADGLEGIDFSKLVPTEKIDGTNIRVTVRSGECLRVEKRKNPTKAQKERGIITPWYIDANRSDSSDKYIFRAVDNYDFSEVPDGEWSAETYGEKIQGNPLNINGNKLFIFSLRSELEKAIISDCDVPTTFEELSEWLPTRKSKFGDGFIEGVVWHDLGNSGRFDYNINKNSVDMVKIKTKNFFDTRGRRK